MIEVQMFVRQSFLLFHLKLIRYVKSYLHFIYNVKVEERSRLEAFLVTFLVFTLTTFFSLLLCILLSLSHRSACRATLYVSIDVVESPLTVDKYLSLSSPFRRSCNLSRSPCHHRNSFCSSCHRPFSLPSCTSSRRYLRSCFRKPTNHRRLHCEN